MAIEQNKNANKLFPLSIDILNEKDRQKNVAEKCVSTINGSPFFQIWGKGPGPFKRGTFPKLGKKSHNEQKIDNVLE